jgi:hypothetical protein
LNFNLLYNFPNLWEIDRRFTDKVSGDRVTRRQYSQSVSLWRLNFQISAHVSKRSER